MALAVACAWGFATEAPPPAVPVAAPSLSRAVPPQGQPSERARQIVSRLERGIQVGPSSTALAAAAEQLDAIAAEAPEDLRVRFLAGCVRFAQGRGDLARPHLEAVLKPSTALSAVERARAPNALDLHDACSMLALVELASDERLAALRWHAQARALLDELGQVAPFAITPRHELMILAEAAFTGSPPELDELEARVRAARREGRAPRAGASLHASLDRLCGAWRGEDWRRALASLRSLRDQLCAEQAGGPLWTIVWRDLSVGVCKVIEGDLAARLGDEPAARSLWTSAVGSSTWMRLAIVHREEESVSFTTGVSSEWTYSQARN